MLVDWRTVALARVAGGRRRKTVRARTWRDRLPYRKTLGRNSHGQKHGHRRRKWRRELTYRIRLRPACRAAKVHRSALRAAWNGHRTGRRAMPNLATLVAVHRVVARGRLRRADRARQ